jgi:hypothetical protein
LTFIIIMYHLELTPKSYELKFYPILKLFYLESSPTSYNVIGMFKFQKEYTSSKFKLKEIFSSGYIHFQSLGVNLLTPWITK